MTTTQQRIIHLWNAAEAYIRQVRTQAAQSDTSSYTAQRKQDHEARLAQKSVNAQADGGVG